MSISSDQATEAAIFLDIYREALNAIQLDRFNLENLQSKMLPMKPLRILQIKCFKYLKIEFLRRYNIK